KGFCIFGSHSHSHALLAFTDSQFGAVQTLVLLGNLVQVDAQTVSQFADGNGNTAGAEVVAAFDQAAGILTAEQPLQFALDGGVAFLNFSAAGFQAGEFVGLG